MMLGACSNNDAQSTEKESAAEIEAAMIHGRTTARGFIGLPTDDTLSLMKHLLDAKTVQSRYLIENKPQQAAAFDSGFIRTIRAVDPSLAAAIEAPAEQP